MRHIGHLPGGQARVFSDFLLSRGIRNEVDRESNGSYSVWVREEDQVPEAQNLLNQFSADPNKPEFSQAATAAEAVRAAEKAEVEAYQRRVKTRSSLFTKVGGYGVGILTYGLIVISVIIAIYTRLGMNDEAVRPFFLTDPEVGGPGLPEVFSGQVWRLFTPMFLHFGPIHLVFNMMWVYQLGSMIEGRRSTWNLLLIVVVTGLASTLAQFYFTGRSNFGGMSGVVYGLAGYVWIRGTFDRASGLFIDRQSITILLVWLVICYFGWMGNVANTAHLVGLISGMICGGIAALTVRR